MRLLYLGITTRTLRVRIAREHLRLSRRSTLRRTLAALLMAHESYRTELVKGHVVLTSADEERLTAWMQAHLRLTWAADDDPAPTEKALIAELGPPLNLTDASPAAHRELLKSARSAYRASADSVGK
ncbi:hypothetical protein FB470_003037 [Amycolatopsis thermophila]|uniref:GIY-YIG catalytic domain-containing protein n=1 Tax=Amycolatopsis thermophila TaxID=206084 RepID=A0ABU0EVB7_9PSEU|nr:hypothetical protein [Amycolatopsis thermophila]MDQ0379043.1 hypothetical protein [Amycolatopsis thermophila]